MPNKLKAIAKAFKEAFLGPSWEEYKPHWADHMPAEGEDVVPPWIQYPGEEHWWGGWRQGNGEGWLHVRWYPFWDKLTYEERQAYIERWPPPNDDWRSWMNIRLDDQTVLRGQI